MSININFFVLFVFLLSIVLCEEEYALLLPKQYDLEDPGQCSENNGIFCKISIKLSPFNGTNNSTEWKMIEDATNDYRYFRRDKLLRGRCFKRNEITNLEDDLENEYASKYRNQSLEGKVEKFECFENEQPSLNDLDYWDISFMILSIIQAVYILVATMHTYFAKHDESTNTTTKLLSMFSIITICKDLRQPIKNEDFQNLKSMQGIRTITTILLVVLHGFYGNLLMFLRNPEYIENIYSNLITRTLLTIFTFLVQTFFLMSAWLLAIRLNDIIKKNGDLTFKDICLMALNRYCRFIPVLSVMIVALRSNTTYYFISYINRDVMKWEVDICQNYWWKNFLFIQNIYEPEKICLGLTWYLATDFQLYLLALGLFYLSHKFKIDRRYLIGIVVVASVITQVIITANTDFQGALRLVPKTAHPVAMVVSKAFKWSYIPIWCNSTTYMIGIIFGTLYINHKQEEIFNNHVKRILWFFAFFGLPIFALFISSFEYDNRFFEILIAIFARPIFGTGVGIGILGMATKTGGLVKMIFENEFLVFLANFSYCVYIFHYSIVFSRTLSEEKMVNLSTFYILKCAVIDCILSYLFGALMYITSEHPCNSLQKLIIPQVKMKKSAPNELSKQSKNGITNLS